MKYVVELNDEVVLETKFFHKIEVELVKYVHVKRAWEMIDELIERGRAEYRCGYYNVVCEKYVGA
jgi:hypothetical protein